MHQNCVTIAGKEYKNDKRPKQNIIKLYMKIFFFTISCNACAGK
jgi:hypothetical protein